MPGANDALHFAGQLIPAGALVTAPGPTTATANVDGAAAITGLAKLNSDRPPATTAMAATLTRRPVNRISRLFDVKRRTPNSI